MKKLMAVSIVFALVGAIAAPAMGGDDEDAARAAFKQGRDYFQAGEYTKAAVALKRAYVLRPHPALLRYLGQTYYKMNRAKDAVRAFKRYLKEAPKAPDRKDILARIREIEMVVGAVDEEEEASPAKASPAPRPAPAAPAKAKAAPAAPKPEPKVDLAPTGEDAEVPRALAEERRVNETTGPVDSVSRRTWMTYTKWVAAGVGVGGIAAGVVFNRLAASKASELEDAVTKSGNADGTTPKVRYAAEHHDLQEAYKRNNTMSIVSLIAGGAATAAAVTLFILDWGDDDDGQMAGKNRRLAVTPVAAPGHYGVVTELSF
jgi:tetratricopeptide (TPR) repeat protein